MATAQKRSGFAQPLFNQSATKKEELGTLRVTQDGRKFRYARAGAGALAAGKLAVRTTVNAHVINQAMPATPAAVPIGTRIIALTAGGAVTYAENYFAGGYFQINDATGEGHQYLIESSTAVSAGTAITITLAEPIRVALVGSTSEWSLIASPWMYAIQATTAAAVPIGVTPIVVTALYYYWAQTGGVANVFTDGTPAIGAKVTNGTLVAGSVKATSAASNEISTIVGYMLETGVDDEYKPVFLTLD